MSRHLSLTSYSLAVIAFLSVAGTAHAKQCTIDADCGDGFECILGDSAGVGGSTGTSSGSAGTGAAVGTACAGPDCPVSSSAPDSRGPQPAPVDGGAAAPQPNPVPPVPPATDAGLAIPEATTGTCRPRQLVCTSKADCPANLDCVKETMVMPVPTCAPNTVCDTTPRTTETGTCKAVCSVDSDCPSPLVCRMQGQTCMGSGSVSSDGKVTTNPTVCSGGNKICTYEPVSCSSNDECKVANFQCAKISEYQSCTGATPACAKPMDGSEPVCTPTPAEPPVCSSRVVNNCMPKQFACEAGQACPTGWSCFDFSYFEDASVPGWTTPMPSKACLPDGLILTIKGQASGGAGAASSGSNPKDNGGGTLGLGGSTGTSGPITSPGGDPITPTQGPVPASDGEEHAATGDAGVEPAATKVRDGGCTLGGQGDSASLWLTLGLAGLVLRLIRRRK